MTDPLNHSYYAATAHAWRPQAFDGDDCSCDVAVIGGGFTGLSAALACAERGFSVILIEREHIGFGASGRNGGQKWHTQVGCGTTRFPPPALPGSGSTGFISGCPPGGQPPRA